MLGLATGLALVGCGGSKAGPPPTPTPTERSWYRDQDGDGYGDPGDRVRSVSRPPGYVEDDTDCDDQATTVHPGASEIIEDGIDQDCDGQDAAFLGIAYARGEMAGEATAESVVCGHA